MTVLFSQLYLGKERLTSPGCCEQLIKISSVGNLITPKHAISFPSNVTEYCHTFIFQAASPQCSNSHPRSYSSLPTPRQQKGYLRHHRGTVPDSHGCHHSPNMSQERWCAAASQDKVWSHPPLPALWGSLVCLRTCSWLSYTDYSFILKVWVLRYAVSLKQRVDYVKASYHK